MKVIVDEKGRPVDVYQKVTKEANWLIEEFMLLANRSVAEFVATGCKGVGGETAKGARRQTKTFISGRSKLIAPLANLFLRSFEASP